MYVSLRDDNALRYIDSSAGTDELCTGCAGDISALTDRGSDAERARVGEGDLDLIRRADGTEDTELKSALRTDDVDLLVRGELTGLAELLLDRELISLSDEDIKSLARHVNMACGGFDHKLFCHNDTFLIFFNLHINFYYNITFDFCK